MERIGDKMLKRLGNMLTSKEDVDTADVEPLNFVYVSHINRQASEIACLTKASYYF